MKGLDNGSNVLVRFHALQNESEKAVLLLLDPTDTEGIWLPKSQVTHLDPEIGGAWIPLWLAEKKGFEYE